MNPKFFFSAFILLLSACTSEVIMQESPYAGQEARGIKSLSQGDVEGLLAGHGTPFGGMAKLAELNGYPGPKHVLELEERMKLTKEQKQEIENIYENMHDQAVPLGKQIVKVEQEMNDRFIDNTITEEYLKEKVGESARLYGELRYTHLKAHLLMMDILSFKQLLLYESLRGYDSNDPCTNIPPGHPPELWKQHHNCE